MEFIFVRLVEIDLFWDLSSIY